MKEKSFIEKNLPLVKSVAGKYKRFGIAFEDLVQEGLIGLMEAQKKFKEHKGTKFSTYAVYWIKKRIIQALEKEKKDSLRAAEIDENLEAAVEIENINSSNTIVLPTKFPELEAKILRLFFEERKTLNEISGILNISRERVRQMKQKALRRLKIGLKST